MSAQQPTPTSPGSFWNQRYSEPGFAYGTAPNDFVCETVQHFPSGGRVACLAEGEGRNAVFIAEQGHDVLALDISDVGLAKARLLAAQRGVPLETEVCDLSQWTPSPDSYDAIVSIWAHLPAHIRASLHQRCVRALRPGGIFVLEAYTPAQIALNTGGPRDVSLLMTSEVLAEELAGLEFVVLREIVRTIDEGPYHRGDSAVVQVLATKPSASLSSPTGHNS
jgi:SAM-dependent methyltransferase